MRHFYLSGGVQRRRLALPHDKSDSIGICLAARRESLGIFERGDFCSKALSTIFMLAFLGISGASLALAPSSLAEGILSGRVEKVKHSFTGHTLRGKEYTVTVSDHGGIRVEVGPDRYDLETLMSYPGKPIGWHRLGIDSPPARSRWRIKITHQEGNNLAISAVGEHYSCDRNIRLAGDRVVVEDTLTNTSHEDVGILYRNELTAPTPFVERLLAGVDQAAVRMTAENPSVFVAEAKSRLGLLMEDAVFRLQLAIASSAHQIRVSVSHFAIRPGKSYTLRWAIYPLPRGADYWTFVNQVRRDWDVNFVVKGPFDFFNLTVKMDLIRDHDRLKAYLARKKLKVIALWPWVDYDNYDFLTGHRFDRHELKSLLQEAAAAFKRVDPEILVIGCMEGNLVSLPLDAQRALWQSIRKPPPYSLSSSYYLLSAKQIAILKKYDLRWEDRLLQNRDGRYFCEFYYRGPKDTASQAIAIAVFASPGNGQHRYWLDEAKFLLEEVGLDGLYIDQFNMAFSDDQRYSYHAWDGTTVDIDGRTGRIIRRYTDGGLVSIGARKDLADYVLRKGGYMLANTFPAVPEMQSVRMHRFNESEDSFDPLSWADGDEPPLRPIPAKGHFSTPIALGFSFNRPGKRYGEENYAKLIMKEVIAYLRHGLLYYHYLTEIPESGPGAGEYGPINHMFPITPVEVHPGWIEGKERTITCVSGSYSWRHERKPAIYVFGLDGKEKPRNFVMSAVGSGWNIEVKLRDWAEIAVLEE